MPRSHNDLQAEMARLSDLGLAELREVWQLRIGRPPPPTGTELTRRWLTWELQARVRGGLDVASRRRLRQLANSLETNPAAGPIVRPNAAPGSVLMREWNGVTHRVVVQDEGFLWNGERCPSLSTIALRITGTRWSGPRFFGLRKT